MNRMKTRVIVSLISLVSSLQFSASNASAQCGGTWTQRIPEATEQERAPEGLSASDWSSIRAAYEVNRHAAFAVEGGFQARSPGQQWRTHFDGRGFVTSPDTGGWSWGLELVNFGREGAERPFGDVVPANCLCGQRVEYEWDETLTEWYINDPRGLEHGYTVRHRPLGGAGPLLVTLTVRGELQPEVSGDRRGVVFVDDVGAAVVNYSGLTVFDADGTAVPAWFADGPLSQAFQIVVDDHTARYPLTIDPIAQQAYLKASNTDVDDEFGQSVAVSGDTVVIGAWIEDSNATGVNGNQADNSASRSGAAYVFVRSGGVWSQQAYLKASNTGASDEFGYSVAASGDTVVVGARGESSLANGSGAAYVFVRSGGVWSQQAHLKASNTGAFDDFGFSVAVLGDTVVVGARQEDSNATGVDGNQADNSALTSGAAYVFVRSGTVWSQQAYLKASNTETNDEFGFTVAVSDDTVVVGAYRESSNATGVNGNQANNSASASGAAYLFVRSSGIWSQQAYLKASNTNGGDQFGWSVAVSGDTLVVGAPHEDSNATGVDGNQANNSADFSGAAYVFVRSGTTWSQQAYLKASNTGGGVAGGDRFGCSLAVSGDTVVVGAQQEDSNATGVDGNQADNSAGESGAAYVFSGVGCPTLGNMNCDCAVDIADLDAFALALLDPDGYAAAYLNCNILNGDMQPDGNVDGLDVPGFMDLVIP